MLSSLTAAPLLAFLWGAADPHVSVGPIFLGERYEQIRASLGKGTAGKLCQRPKDPASCIETLSYGDGDSTAILQFDPAAPAHNLTSITIVMHKSDAPRLAHGAPIGNWNWERSPVTQPPPATIDGWQSGKTAGKGHLLGFRRIDSGGHIFQTLYYVESGRVDQFVVAMLK
jgi:hypothetical protein